LPPRETLQDQAAAWVRRYAPDPRDEPSLRHHGPYRELFIRQQNLPDARLITLPTIVGHCLTVTPLKQHRSAHVGVLDGQYLKGAKFHGSRTAISADERTAKLGSHCMKLNRREFIVTAGVTALASSSSKEASSQTNPSRSDPERKMTQTSTISLELPTPKICKVIFSNPPVNLIVPETVSRLHEVVKELSEDAQVQVVIFTSSVSDYFFNHFNLAEAGKFPLLPGAESMPVWVDLVLRLSKAPFISIASIRGRTRGGGNELTLACDLRYASREHALFGQPEVGSGILPGGGGSERLPRLIGRDRALEAILSSDDYDADLAERYGWVTRAIADAELDSFVDSMAARLASFDKSALAAAKAQVNRATLPPDADLRAAYAEYVNSLRWPGFQARRPRFAKIVAEKGLEEMERRLGYYIGSANRQP
jgi:enoyl-CoA hydratase/carnithine racemase